jgi:hypothetical protein
MDETLNQKRMQVQWRKLRIRSEWRSNGGNFESGANEGPMDETSNQKKRRNGENFESEANGNGRNFKSETSNQKPMEWRELRIRS